jgi:hypothetical protein
MPPTTNGEENPDMPIVSKMCRGLLPTVTLLVLACNGDPTAPATPAPTPVPMITETFTGTASCYDFHEFTMSTAGTVQAKFTRISRSEDLLLRLIEGVCPGSCNAVASQTVGIGTVVEAQLSAGTRTVSGGDEDSCNIFSPTTYTVEVTHPM